MWDAARGWAVWGIRAGQEDLNDYRTRNRIASKRDTYVLTYLRKRPLITLQCLHGTRPVSMSSPGLLLPADRDHTSSLHSTPQRRLADVVSRGGPKAGSGL